MIYLASDHGGFKLKENLKQYLPTITSDQFEDIGDKVLDENDDFVDFVSLAAPKITEGDYGIFSCRNGVGVDIVANRFKNVRSVLGFNEEQVKKARIDDNCNVLCLPADYLNEETIKSLVAVFLQTKFSTEERFLRRLKKIEQI